MASVSSSISSQFSPKTLTRVAFAIVYLLALTPFVVASTPAEKEDIVDVAPRAIATPGPRLSVGTVESYGPFLPTPTVAARDLPAPIEWQPGDPIREIPKLGREGWVPPTPTPEAWDVDPLVGLQRGFAPEGFTLEEVFTTPVVNVPGSGFTGVNPPDTVGDVGPSHYVQMINGGGTVVTILNKDGTLNTSFALTSLGGCSTGGGDPIVLYDDLADRWLISEFGAGNSLCVFISQTPDPTGAYFSYNFPTPNFPDYPKYGVWPSATNSAYFVGSNEATGAAYALDRAQMIAGLAATSQRFAIPDLAGFGFQMSLPAHADGLTPPPAGRNNVFMRQRDDEVHNVGSNNPTQDFLEMWEFTIDFAVPANSSLTQLADIPVTEFSSELCGLTSFACVPQPGTATLLDPLREVIMHALQYRNYGSHESILGTYVVDVEDFADHHAMRWFELRATGGGAFSLYQEGTYSPDSDHRWMGSIAQDQEGNIALGYSVSSSTTSPSMRYTGRLAGDTLGLMTQAETSIIAGSGNNASNRWGDYSAMHVDPADDCTFWHTNLYTDGSGVWNTQIAAFKFDACGDPGISFSGDPLSQQVCAPGGNLSTADINLTIGSIQGFTGSTDLSFGTLPGGFSGAFTVDPVTPPGTSVAQMTLTGAADGLATFDIDATPPLPADPRQITVGIEVFSIAPAAPTLLTPMDTATDVATVPAIAFSWTNTGATNYFIEVAIDAGFTTVIASANTAATSINGTGFPPATLLFWRVTASNPCGGSTSSTFSFTTSSAVPLTLGDDDSQNVALPFPFNFCGTTYNDVWVGSNGYVTFGGPDTDFSETVAELIGGAPNPARIAMLWDDLNPSAGGTVLTDVSGGNFVITYDSVPEFSNTGANTFVLTLRPDGTFNITYGAISATDGLAGHAVPGQNDGGETDLSAASQPISGFPGDALYEIFTAADNDLGGENHEYAPCLAGVIADAQPDVCYGSSAFNGPTGNLYTIDVTTGAALLVGNIHPGAGIPGLAINSSGDMFATTDTGELRRVDAQTAFSLGVGFLSPAFAGRAIAFSPGDVLYGTEGFQLYTIDPLTAATTPVGTGFGGGVGSGMRGLAFDPSDGTLYGSDNGDQIYTIDTTTGLATALPNPVGVAVGASAYPDIHFHDGLLYGATSGFDSAPDTLVLIDKVTGIGAIVNAVGSIGVDGITGMAATPPVCGDNQLDLEVGEECDDGNLIDGDGCQSTCLLPVCGDGIIDPGEQCEPPSVGICDASCMFNVDLIPLDDDDFAEITLPFAFPFCGVDYTSVFVNANGNLTFGSGDGDWSESVGELLSDQPRIAPFWNDLRPAGGGLVYWQQIGADFLVTFDNIPEFFSTGANTATVTLRPDGTHQIAYGAVSMLDGLAGRSRGGGVTDPGEIDLTAEPQPIGTGAITVYEQFTAFDNDLAGESLEFAGCVVPNFYHPVENCLALHTIRAADKFDPGEVRGFEVRGPTKDLSAQGGSATGCGVPENAEALVLNLKAQGAAGNGQLMAFEPGQTQAPSVLNFKSGHSPFHNQVIVPLTDPALMRSPEELTTPEFSLKATQAVHVIGHVVGYFARPGGSMSFDGETEEASESRPALVEVLSAGQLERFVAGEDPSTIQLGDGTLEDLLAEGLIDSTSSGAYHPVANCVVAHTIRAGGKFAVNETRTYAVRGPTTDLSDQGGSATGCGVADDATAVALNFNVQGAPGNGQAFAFSPGTQVSPSILNFGSGHPPFNNAVIVPLDAGLLRGLEGAVPLPMEFAVKLNQVAHLVVHVVGYFSPTVLGSTPPAAPEDEELQRPLIERLSPSELERFLAGEDPATIELAEGTLADLLAAGLIDSATENAYIPLDNCVVLHTIRAGAKFSPNESRSFAVRGPTTDLSPQGGSADGCGVAENARAVAMNFKVQGAAGNGQAFVFSPGTPAPPSVLNFTNAHPAFNNEVIVPLDAGLLRGLEGSTGLPMEFSVKLNEAAHVVGHVVGYFAPVP